MFFIKILKYKNSNNLSRICKRYLNENCSAYLNINILKSVNEEDPSSSRILGIPTQIEFYDTYRLNKNVKYLQSSLKTILLLPGTNTNYRIYDHMIDYLFEKFNYRFITLNFPGVGNSKLLAEDSIYNHDIKQKSRVVTTFLCDLLPFREKPIDCVIAFDDSCYLVPFLGSHNDSYRGIKSALLVNPTQPAYISKFKEKIKKLENNKPGDLYRKHAINDICLKEIKNISIKDIKTDELHDEFRTWSSIDNLLTEQALYGFLKFAKNLLFILYENDKYYDQSYCNNFKNSINDLYGDSILTLIKNIKADDTRIFDFENKNRFYNLYKDEIIILCVDFIQKKI